MEYFAEIQLKLSEDKIWRKINAPDPDEAIHKLDLVLSKEFGPDGFYIKKLRPDDFGEVEYV